MSRFKFNSSLLIFLLVVLVFAISLIFRIVFPYDKIFVNGDVKFASNDVYFYTRLIDNLAHNFPNLTSFDPYLIFPGGGTVGSLPIFHWLIAFIAWIFGAGSPTQHLVDLVEAYVPAISAALAVIPAFFLGKTLFNRWAGVIAAGLVAILPGEFMTRTSLAAVDTPVAEILFTTTAMMFLVLAIKSSREKNLNFSHLRHWDWPTIRLPLLYMLLAGLFLGLYLAAWLGALLFVFIILCYFLLQFVNNHLRGKPTDHLAMIGFVSFLIALIIFTPRSTSRDLTLAMWVALFVPIVLWGISRLISRFNLKTYVYPLALVGLGAILLAIVHAAAPDMYGALWVKFKFVFFPSGSTATTTQEMQPFLMPSGVFTTLNAWGNFATSFFLIRGWPIPGIGLIAFAILLFVYIRGENKNQSWYVSVVWVIVILAMLMMLLVILTHQKYRGYAIIPLIAFIYLFLRQKKDNDHWLLFFVWSLVIFIATMVQRRFAYYLAINISLLSGYLSWEIIALAKYSRGIKTTEEKQQKEQVSRHTDYYKTLGVTNNASYREIKTAFRKLSADNQQIKNPTLEQVQKQKEINNAFEVLSNPDRRPDYDASITKLASIEKKRNQPSRSTGSYRLYTALLVIVVLFSVYFFNITHAWDTAGAVPFVASDGWQQALTWMKDNTPEPLGDPQAYYNLYSASTFQYPDTAYGVTTWWDYGYWVTGIAHRIPSANPSQDPAPIRKIAHLFLSENETSARELMKELDSSYVIIDTDTTISKYWAMGDWAGEPADKYINIYYISYQGNVVPLTLFEPSYYQTLSVRLYNFDGKAVSSSNTTVITYETLKDKDGTAYRYITDAKIYSNYQEAVAAISSNSTTTQRIVGTSPFISPISMEAIKDYTLVYRSEYGSSYQNAGFVPQVKIFQYTP